MDSSAYDEDDDLRLPPDTLATLASFLSEQEAQRARFAELAAKAEEEAEARRNGIVDGDQPKGVGKKEEEEEERLITMDLFEEDWNMSQFWYDEKTAERYARALCGMEGVEGERKITVGIVSAPSVFVKLREMKAKGLLSQNVEAYLLEYDTRFKILGDEFIFYDFRDPVALPQSLKQKFDCILVDPPFLSEECLSRASMTVKWLLKSCELAETKVIVSTGERMKDVIPKWFAALGVRETNWEPRHKRGLSNEFRCYANFEEVGREEGWEWMEKD